MPPSNSFASTVLRLSRDRGGAIFLLTASQASTAFEKRADRRFTRPSVGSSAMMFAGAPSIHPSAAQMKTWVLSIWLATMATIRVDRCPKAAPAG